MGSATQVDRRNRLAYLALYYAIQGDNERSEKLRRLVLQMSAPGRKGRVFQEEPVAV